MAKHAHRISGIPKIDLISHTSFCYRIAFMYIYEGNRSEGIKKIPTNNNFVLEKVDCILNRNAVHKSGIIYLTDQYAFTYFLLHPEVLSSFLLLQKIIIYQSTTMLLEC